MKLTFEKLLAGESITAPIDEQIVYSQLDDNEGALWSLMVSAGYLKVVRYEKFEPGIYDLIDPKYELALTKRENFISTQTDGSAISGQKNGRPQNRPTVFSVTAP